MAPLLSVYAEAAGPLAPMVHAFDAAAVQDWARDLGQPVFTGSTGRVFPRAMKASPLVRAWLARLSTMGVQLRTRMRWLGWDGRCAVFETPEGQVKIEADVTVLALGGASWSRLGADGRWAPVLAEQGVGVAPFAPANVGARVVWSAHMERHIGTALKGIRLSAGHLTSRGEAVIGADGLEGGGIYEISRGLRDGHALRLDLLPDLSVNTVIDRLSRPRGKASLSTVLRKTLRLDPGKIALAQEVARPLPREAPALARTLKSLPVPIAGLRPMDEAISVAGGVRFDALDAGLMLRARPGVFCAGEMLDWEAPTGGYLLTACLATGRWAGLAAAAHLSGSKTANGAPASPAG